MSPSVLLLTLIPEIPGTGSAPPFPGSPRTCVSVLSRPIQDHFRSKFMNLSLLLWM